MFLNEQQTSIHISYIQVMASLLARHLHRNADRLETGLALEDRQQVLLMETADFREAVAAFKEKRAPQYRDH